MIPEVEKLTFDKLFHNHKLITFHIDLQAMFTKERVDGVYVLDVPEFKIFALGDSLEDCKADLADQLVHMWREYVECGPETLSGCAVQLRNKLRNWMTIKTYVPCARCGSTGKLRMEQLYDNVNPALVGLDASFACPDCLGERMKADPIQFYTGIIPVTHEDKKPWYRRLWDKIKNIFRRNGHGQ